jgi:hypothetical protein
MKARYLLPLCLAGLTHGQVYTPPPTAPPAAVTPVDQGPGKEKSAPAAGPLGQEIPLLDPSAETITVGGVAIPLGDNRLLKARFEKYLAQPPESDEAATQYRETIADILGTISPFKTGGPDLYAAFKKLPGASAYPGDANLCSSLAESIYMAMLAKQDIRGLTTLNQAMEDEKKSLINDADWQARQDKETRLKETKTKDVRSGAVTSSVATTEQAEGTGTQSVKYKDSLRRIAEIEALKKTNVVRTETQTIRTKAQYQVSMVQWFIQRRYEHVLMAARFYNQIWKDGDTTLRIDKKSDVSKLFSESVGVSPTVASLDSLSNEAIRETTKYIEAFELMLSRDELHSASQRLMEAFALGEYLAPVATLSLEKKRRIADYARDLNELYGTLQAHDYTKTKELADRLKATAKDFPSSKVDSAIAGYTLASDLAIEEAKAHLLAKDSDKAAEKIRAAAEIWPTNPKLAEFRTLVNNSGAVVSTRNDFDRLLSEGNFREIARRQYEIAPSIHGDPTREDAFKQIMTNLTKIETALGKAAEFSKVGQNYAAWEQLAKLREEFPDDPKLGRELELLAPQVADFTRSLDRARQFESRDPRQTGSALSWYLKARSIYPLSDFAEAGVKRLANEILPPDGANNGRSAEN